MSIGLKRKIRNMYRKCFTTINYGLRSNVQLGKNTFIDGKIEIDRNGKVVIGDNSIVRNWVCLKPWGRC